MKTGWLIVNEYLDTEKFKEIQRLFIEASDRKNVKLIVHTNAEFAVNLNLGVAKSKAFEEGMPAFVIFYDKDLALARALEQMGLELFNCAQAIEVCDSKVRTAEYIAAYNGLADESGEPEGVRMPKTFKVPFSYENIGIAEKYKFDFLDSVERELSADGKKAYPVIIKESNSSFGMGVHLAHNREEAIELISKYGNKECLIQEYLEYASGLDVRLQMVGEKCVCAMMRSNVNDFRSNLTNGGIMSSYEPVEADIKMAKAVMKCLNLDFAGIDIMHDENGLPVFCEANSNAHFKNLYDLTGINTAEYMIDYILECIGND